MEHEPERLEVLDRRLDGQGEPETLRSPGAPGTARSPGRWPGRAAEPPSSPNRAINADRGSSATAPIRRSPKRVSRARTSGSVVRRPDGRSARNAASSPGGTTIGASGPGGHRGDRRREVRAGDRRPVAGSHLPGEGLATALGQPLDEDRLRAPQRPEPVDADLEQPERRVERVAAPRQARAEPPERLEHGLGSSPVRLGIGVDEGRLRDESMGAPERHPAPDAERPSVRIGVDDRPRIPRPTAQHERAGREGLGASGQRQVEGQVRQEQVETSHGRGLAIGGLVTGTGWVLTGAWSINRASRARHASRSPPSA